MDNTLLDLNKVYCRYHPNKPKVLEIDKLKFQQGKLYFIVGPSGVGKSTILESLGLMSRVSALEAGGTFNYNFSGEGESYTIKYLWERGDRFLAKFRQKHLSFIFQNTNLFPNLSAYENACISQVMQGLNLDEAKLRVRKLLFQIFEEDLVDQIIKGKPIQQMSGGQRQRLAFVRALGTTYDLLLADEPTGNLDHFNAANLLSFLRAQIKSENKTAIIVSHDIDLATKFGDEIVLIKRIQKKGQLGQINTSGLINKDSLFSLDSQSNLWSSTEGKPFVADELIPFLKARIQHKVQDYV